MTRKPGKPRAAKRKVRAAAQEDRRTTLQDYYRQYMHYATKARDYTGPGPMTTAFEKGPLAAWEEELLAQRAKALDTRRR